MCNERSSKPSRVGRSYPWLITLDPSGPVPVGIFGIVREADLTKNVERLRAEFPESTIRLYRLVDAWLPEGEKL